MKPDFICIGAQKAGTTWLYFNLNLQTGFSMPPIKEFHYFDRSENYPSMNTLSVTRASERLRSPAFCKLSAKRILRALARANFRRACWWAQYSFSDYSDSWYTSLFGAEPGITGDITPSYSILNEEDVRRMHAAAPNAKIIFLIRNPIDRAWSMFRFMAKSERNVDVTDIGAFISFTNSPGQELRSDYLRTIDLYSKYYDPKRILIGFYDAVSKDPEGLLGEILKHLGAKEPMVTQGLRKVANESVSVTIPVAFKEHLKERYRSDIHELAARFGSYAKDWQLGLDGGTVGADAGPSRHPATVHP
ncbi:MAG: sulfotransferase domain-containing protein [Luteolibacter sp.]